MNTTKIAVIGKPGNITNSFQKNTETLFKEVGLNTGNLAFWYAMSKYLAGDISYYGWSIDPLYLKANYDIIVFPAANQLNPDWDLGILANLFDKAELPIVVCGLGAQSPKIGTRLSFKPGSKRFMSVISERSGLIGVRGSYTAEVLQQHNINNVEITGCPSNFINDDAELGQKMESKFKRLKQIDSINMNLDLTEGLKHIMSNIFHWGLGRRIEVVNQAPLEVLKVSLEGPTPENMHHINRIRHILAPGTSTKYFCDVVKSSFTSYFDTTEWLQQMKKHDLAIGTRMHGNMLSWQAGTPAVWLPHDSRLSEMVDIMKLPQVSIDSVKPHHTLEQTLKEVNFDGQAYDNQRTLLKSRFLKVLNGSGIQLNKLTDVA